METQPPEIQVKMLATRMDAMDGRVGTVEDRVTTHGREIDAIREQLIRTQERDEYRDRQMSSIETKVDQVSGKLDVVAARPAQKDAARWDKATWALAGGILSAAAYYIATHIGF